MRQQRGKWVIRYYDEHGRQVQRTTSARTKRLALSALRTALDEVERARGRGAVRTVADLVVFDRRQRVALAQSVAELDHRWKPLAPLFGPVDVNGVTTAMLASYREQRAQDGVCKSTTNREIATLRRLLRAGARATPPIVDWGRIPRFELADESDRIRTVFFDEATWAQLRPHLADHLQALFTVAYAVGWRRRELLDLLWSQVDLVLGTLRLSPGRTKNKEGRLVYLPPEALAALRAQHDATRALERKLQRVIPWVFHFRGNRIGSYNTGWHAALRRAGFSPKAFTPHDFRRTAARDYIRAGVTEPVAMKITGHLTPHVFRRYNITAEPDLAAAARQIARVRRPRKERARNGG